MNRIYRRVWNRQLNALVVASELATGDSGGSAARDPRAFLLMPTTLALALLCVLASGHAGASESNQSLRDLQALAAKYTQPMPVKVDAEVALAAAASQAQSSPAISADARVGLQLSTASLPVVRDVLPASVQVKLAANTAPKQVAVPRLAADVRANANIGLGGAQVASIDAGAKAAAGISGAPAGALRGLKASVDGALDSKLKVAGHQIDAQGQVKATAAITLPAKEELPGETHDRAITAAFDAGAAGKVRVQAPNGQEVVADRNLKLAGQATVAAQNSALGVGGLVGSAVGAAGNAVGGAVGGALNGTVGSVGGAVGGTLNNTVGAVGGALNGTVGSVGGAVGGALNGTVGSVGGAVGGTLNGTVGTVGGAVGGALNGTVGSVGGAVGGTLNSTVGAVGGALNGAVGTVGGAVGGALNGTVGSVGGAVGGTLNNTVGAVGGALNGAVGTVGGAVGGALNGTVGSVGGAVGGTLNNTVGAVGGALNGTAGSVGGAVGGTLNNTVGAVGGALNGTVGTVGGAVGGALNGAVGSVGGAVGGALNGTVGSVGGAVGGTVGSVGTAVGGTLNNTVGSVGGLLNGATGSGTGLGGLLGNTLGNVGSAVGNLLNGNLNGTLGNLGSAVGGLVGGTLGGLGLTKPSAIPPTSPKAPAPADPNAGLIIGTGGLVGNVGQLIGPTTTSLFGGDGYLSNGNLKLSNANVMQTYSTVNVLGLPVVNLSPVGSTLNGLGGAATGGSSHLTLIGGVTSDSYIYNINNGNPGGLLGLLLPKDSPAWAAKCLDVALADISCWAVNAAQDYQVLMGDGAFANGSKEVVIGANARHELPKVDANVAFPGDGVNDPSNPTGVPTADYAARMGHSVIVGDSAVGTANGQTLLGAEATSNQANSVALGYRSAALRGAQASYSAYGLTAPQVSAGEVSVGTAGGGERQITNVAAGSVNTDAVNVAQLKGAISLINGVADAAVTYDLDAGGNPNYRRVTLGAGTGTTTIGNLAGGAVTAGSLEAVNGGQLAATNAAIASFFGGRAAFDPASGAFTAPLFEISTISTGGAIAKGLYENATDAFAAVDGSLVNLNTQITDIRNGGTRYLRVNSTGTEALATGADSIAVGTNARATAANSIAVGAGSLADRANSVSIGAAGAERQVTNMAAGTAATDAVNLGQLQASEQGALRYDLNGDGSVNYASATLGQSGTATTLRNLGPGQVSATSSEAINGAQLFAANQAVATHLGGGAAVNASGVLTAPTYSINNVAANGTITKGNYNDVGTAFDAVSNSLANVADQTGEIDKLAVKYDVDASGNVLNNVTLTGTGTGAVKITNVAAGSILAGSSDAITGDQLFSTHSTIANYFGGTTAYNGTTNVWTAPKFSISSIATDGTFTSGDYNNVTAAFTAVDGSLKVLNQRITNGGGGSAYLAVNSTAAAATAAGAEAVAVGPQASAAGANSVAVGNGASASAGNSVALGAGSVASVGAQSGYTGAYGQTGASNSAGEVSVGSTGSERKITHVADGSDTYDATNVGQLKNGVNYAIDESKKYTDQKIQNITNVAGSFRANNTNNLADPSASGANSAAGGAGSTAAGANSTALGNGSQAQADNSVALGAGSVANRANTVSVGAAGAERQVVNVADGSQATDAVNVRQLQASQQGTIRYDTTVNGATNYNSVTLGSTSSGPTTVRNVAAGTAGTDAVNVDQLKSGMAQTLDWSKAYTDERMGGFERDLRKTDNRASAGIASAMATAALPQPSEAGRSMASVAAGSYNGESGVAIGISGVSEGGRWIYKFSGSTNSRGEAGVAVGAGIQW
ncbi:ESPR-type extended signal peptide-containing protein [Stenotrophomonas maltophilia]|uniref:ESPR-type extended signal peptide-containing protein n=11 Tax=Stenotrophomonas maltophilia TaxID=40324 RepID=UPI00244D6D5E|nr:ESPR-type extended signal peptide-containing protein [Stenotrophomonas maltophilia]MDH0073373.1 ESPR-type extended signal peptide-containing protein [Stenotrophomonas maltophilia]MDH0106063.1 ESPR-type extended signal peptide-containing protein [Stenotrophomonas maltophilia]MDH0332788.1 ESPR-type extended signal peptide-containing protein [Stenotrophomonas maltophilia]MDH0632427.1 ESPR-type extended signal peptide-containing protein [Stenotrophomonas maltophilia]MDH0642746.1 ESPR-type exten